MLPALYMPKLYCSTSSTSFLLCICTMTIKLTLTLVHLSMGCLTASWLTACIYDVDDGEDDDEGDHL